MAQQTVLLVHGIASNHEHNWVDTGWVDVLESEGHHVIPVRLPGHGGAPPGSTVDAVLKVAGDATGPAAAVGFSAGAIGLLAAMAEMPDLFTRAAVLGIGDHVLAAEPPDVQGLALALRNDGEPQDMGLRTIYRLAARTGNDRAAVATFLESTTLVVDPDRLAKVGCPVLVAVGERDDALPADRLVAALPDAHLLVLPHVDHFGTTSSLACVDAVSRFLAR